MYIEKDLRDLRGSSVPVRSAMLQQKGLRLKNRWEICALVKHKLLNSTGGAGHMLLFSVKQEIKLDVPTECKFMTCQGVHKMFIIKRKLEDMPLKPRGQ